MKYEDLTHEEREALLKQARRDWRAEYERAKKALFNAQMELRRLDLLIKAYETQLSSQIEPDTKEWDDTWEKLQKTKLLREEYFQGECLRAFWDERHAYSRDSHMYPSEEGKFFQEWLENH